MLHTVHRLCVCIPTHRKCELEAVSMKLHVCYVLQEKLLADRGNRSADSSRPTEGVSNGKNCSQRCSVFPEVKVWTEGFFWQKYWKSVNQEKSAWGKCVWDLNMQSSRVSSKQSISMDLVWTGFHQPQHEQNTKMQFWTTTVELQKCDAHAKCCWNGCKTSNHTSFISNSFLWFHFLKLLTVVNILSIISVYNGALVSDTQN